MLSGDRAIGRGRVGRESMPTTLPVRTRTPTQITPTRIKVDGRDNGTDRIIARELLSVVAFCVLGLSITVSVMLRFPALGALIESYNLF
jgi:hypothetical protein